MRQSGPAEAAVTPLLELDGVSKTYSNGNDPLTVLHEVNLRIDASEMVAIVGVSGSGKSTLMNLLGCLDQPTTGTYRISGGSTQTLGPDQLAQLRREHFGFVFQRYQLLSDLSAQANVEMPAIYAGVPRTTRHERAQALRARLGLRERLDHRPGQLSGGQQQRVSIARALMNGGQVILADEPTGALDSQSGEALIALLAELNAEGHTIVIVTHDMEVARHARRIIEIRDGRIVADRSNEPPGESPNELPHESLGERPVARLQTSPSSAELPQRDRPTARAVQRSVRLVALDRLREALHVSLLSTTSHGLRTFLTMLGVIIGTVSVVCVIAIGEGSRQYILARLSEFGTNTVTIFPGHSFAERHADEVHTLTVGDVDALREQTYLDSVTPVVSTSGTLRVDDITASANVNGVDTSYFRVSGKTLKEGVAFNDVSVTSRAQEVVIDEHTRQTLFQGNPAIGKTIFVGAAPCRVIGVVAGSDESPMRQLSVWLPYTSVMARLTAQYYVDNIVVRIADGAPIAAALRGMEALLMARHGRQDFHTFNSVALRGMVTEANESITLLLSIVAAISLLVGGIGVMNIMLVSVTERTYEIGVRVAVGARASDIRNQFLIEAVLLCLSGGVIGILVALVVGVVYSRPDSNHQMIFSVSAMLASFASATLTGMVFGFAPAIRAARMNPIDALARE